MIEFLPPLPLLITFIAASFILAVTPGPGVLYILMRTLSQGRASGLASVAGVALGNLGNAMGACFGLAVLFAISSLAFTVVKCAGAFYLIYLGIKTLRETRHAKAMNMSKTKPRSLKRIFTDGFLVALLNPKTALFFAAFLPQFLNPEAATLPQSAALGVLFILIAGTTDTLYALLAGFVVPFFKKHGMSGTLGHYMSGSTFIGLGILTALTPQKH